jgi:hypothetical protein
MDFDNKLKPKVETVSLFSEQEQAPKAAPKQNDLKATFQDRFSKLFPNKRLLGVQLDGFSHKIYADDGTGEGEVEVIRYIPQAPEQGYITPETTKFFEGHPNHKYQGNAKEIIYVRPNQRKVRK